MTATLTKWYEEHGRHEIFAGGKNVKLRSTEHHLVLKEEIVSSDSQRAFEHLAVVKNAREDMLRAHALRNDRNKENSLTAKLYREFVLKEQTAPELVQIRVGATMRNHEIVRESLETSGD